MSVVIETTLGDITIDLYLEQRPVTCLNFLKLCKMKYYNFNLFHTIRSGFIAQTGDPTGEGSGGQSIWGILEGPKKRFFSGEKMPKIRHTDAGLLSMVCTDDMMVGSQFFITLAPDLDSLDGTHCVIGEVTEGHEVLTQLNEVICDETHRPYRDVRITHTVVLEDPFSDPAELQAPSRSPSPNPERLKGGRIAPDEEVDETQGKSFSEIQEMIEEKEAKARATILEIVGDLPDAEIAPPENVLFICKLNPVTTDEDLEIIFSRFGKIVSCEVIRDKKTENSLQYAFIEFENKQSCEDAYFKMDNVLIDDRRIHVDFSQSVSKMRWLGKGRGVQYLDDNSKNLDFKTIDKQIITNVNQKRENRISTNKDDHRNDKYGQRKEDRPRNDDRHRRDDTNKKEYRERSRSRVQDFRDRQRETDRQKERHFRDKERHNENGNSDQYGNNSRCHKSKYSSVRNRKNLAESRVNHKILEQRQYNNEKKYDKHTNSNAQKDGYKSGICKNQKNESNHKTKDEEEPKTPSPSLKSKRENDNVRKGREKQLEKNSGKKITKKRKPRPSTSSSSDSSTSSSSSSSSESSSSSDSDKNKKRSKRKKRKYTTSSTSSDSSTTSSSSSETSSSSSSSNIESNKKKKKTVKKKKYIKHKKL